MIRSAGLLMHPSSLPGRTGIGEIGPAARALIDWMQQAGQRVWQVLPLNPVDRYGCPYASGSAFAREPLLLSIDDLIRDGWLQPHERPDGFETPHRVDWERVRAHKMPALMWAAHRVRQRIDLESYAQAQPALNEWALFHTLQLRFGDDWPSWPRPLRERDPQALADYRASHIAQVLDQLALQWLFAQQWAELRHHAASRGVSLWGDLPFFVGLSSCDVWSQPELWRLNEAHEPQVISGVPPDAFSPVGQRWGHPLYDEAAHHAQGHAWWLGRVASALELCDKVRLDHFRGLSQVWEIPAHAEDATSGRWIDGPGASLLERIRARWPEQPLIAEDLGIITADVRELRDAFGLPGMVILQFAFGAPPQEPSYNRGHAYLPHNHQRNQVVYTGTHDNNTIRGWSNSLPWGVRDHAQRYLGVGPHDLPYAMLRAAWRSAADTCILPIQDMLLLDSDARMNVPGEQRGQWAWRLWPGALSAELAHSLRAEAVLSGRI